MASPYSQSETAYVYPIAAREEGNEVSVAGKGPPGHQLCLGHHVVLPTPAPSQAPLCSPSTALPEQPPPPLTDLPQLSPQYFWQYWSQKELLEAAVSSLKPRSKLPSALPSILPAL